MLLVGSAAFEFWGINLGRKPNDYDVICYRCEFDDLVKSLLNQGFNIVRLDTSKPNVAMVKVRKDDVSFIIDASLVDNEEINPSTNKYLVNHVNSWFTVHSQFGEIDVATIPVLVAMKFSHKYKKNDSIHFEKTRKDILNLQSLGYKVEEEFKDIYNARKAVAEGLHYKLNVKKDEFFTDNVKYVYDHDDIHEVVKLFDKPAYRFYLKDGEQVMCDKDKFFALPAAVRNAGVFEESCVLALERAVVPFGADFRKSFQLALKKVCTSITSGWFREYAWENYDTIKAMMEVHHDRVWANWLHAVQYGQVRRHGYDKERN